MNTDSDTTSSVAEQNAATPSDEHAAEVLAFKDWYAEEYAALAAGETERLERSHFAVWADKVVLTMQGNDAQSVAFREYIADPERYPGGRDALRADAIHAEALRQVLTRAQTALRDAQRAVGELDLDVQQITRQRVCPFCQRKRNGLRTHESGYANLDQHHMCEDCFEKAQTEYKAWRQTPVRVRDSW